MTMQINDYLKLVHFRNDLSSLRADFDVGLSELGLSEIRDELSNLINSTESALIQNAPVIKQLTVDNLEEISSLPYSTLIYIYRAIIETSIKE